MLAVGYPDGWLALVDAGRQVRYVEFDGPALSVSTAPHDASIVAVALPDRVVVTCPDGTQRAFTGPQTRPTCVRLVPTSDSAGLVIAGDERGNIFRWTPDRADRPITTRVHRKGVNVLRLDATAGPAGTAFSIVSASDDREVAIAREKDLDVRTRLGEHAGWIEQLELVGPRGSARRVLTVDRVGVAVWDTERRERLRWHNGRATTATRTHWCATTGHCIAALVLDERDVLLDDGFRMSILDQVDRPVSGLSVRTTELGDPVITAFAIDEDHVLARRVGVNRHWESIARLPLPVRCLWPWPGPDRTAAATLSDGSVWMLSDVEP